MLRHSAAELITGIFPLVVLVGITTSVVAVGTPPHQFEGSDQSLLVVPTHIPEVPVPVKALVGELLPEVVLDTVIVPARAPAAFGVKVT